MSRAFRARRPLDGSVVAVNPMFERGDGADAVPKSTLIEISASVTRGVTIIRPGDDDQAGDQHCRQEGPTRARRSGSDRSCNAVPARGRDAGPGDHRPAAVRRRRCARHGVPHVRPLFTRGAAVAGRRSRG